MFNHFGHTHAASIDFQGARVKAKSREQRLLLEAATRGALLASQGLEELMGGLSVERQASAGAATDARPGKLNPRLRQIFAASRYRQTWLSGWLAGAGLHPGADLHGEPFPTLAWWHAGTGDLHDCIEKYKAGCYQSILQQQLDQTRPRSQSLVRGDKQGPKKDLSGSPGTSCRKPHRERTARRVCSMANRIHQSHSTRKQTCNSRILATATRLSAPRTSGPRISSIAAACNALAHHRIEVG